MKVKIFMKYSQYQKYVKEVSFYNSTLEEGITKCFTNGYCWYKCNGCSFMSKHKHDAKRHYSRIHIHNKKSYKQRKTVIDFGNTDKRRKKDRKLKRTRTKTKKTKNEK